MGGHDHRYRHHHLTSDAAIDLDALAELAGEVVVAARSTGDGFLLNHALMLYRDVKSLARQHDDRSTSNGALSYWR